MLPMLWQQFGEVPNMAVMIRYPHTFGHTVYKNMIKAKYFNYIFCLIIIIYFRLVGDILTVVFFQTQRNLEDNVEIFSAVKLL